MDSKPKPCPLLIIESDRLSCFDGECLCDLTCTEKNDSVILGYD